MFDINYVELFRALPEELAVVFISVIPIAELRVSIPIALTIYKMSVAKAFFLSVAADILLAGVIIYFLGWVYKFISGRSKTIDNFFNWLFQRTRKKFAKDYESWGNVALMIFVGIPLPFTGVWTGSIAAWLFGIPKRKAWLYVALGVIISAVIVTGISLGIFKIF